MASNQVKTNKLIKHLLDYGLDSAADLIVLEPDTKTNDQQFKISYRTPNNENDIDFVLPQDLAKSIINNLQAKAGINNRQREGQLILRNKEQSINYSVTAFRGPKLVLQPQLKPSNVIPAIDLGLEIDDLELLKNTILTGKGLVILSGPQSAGKTTTAYSLLQAINGPQLNITTIEPVPKQRLADINQIEKHKTIDLNQVLRSLAIQDADILYLGQLESGTDISTLAKLASNKLIFINMPGVDSLDVLTKLKQLPLFDNSFYDQLKLIINQRLVRKNCPHCSIVDKLDYYTLDDLHNQFELDDTKALRQLKFKTGQGCPNCGYSGHHGQTAIFEIVPINQNMITSLRQHMLSDIKQIIESQDNNSLFENAFAKAVQGHINIKEVQSLF